MDNNKNMLNSIHRSVYVVYLNEVKIHLPSIENEMKKQQINKMLFVPLTSVLLFNGSYSVGGLINESRFSSKYHLLSARQ